MPRKGLNGMLRTIAVCDDEKAVIRQLAGYLEQIRNGSEDTFDVYYYSSARELYDNLERDTEILLMDISMDGMTGMECARKLREEGFEGDIIFITSMEGCAVEGYSVHAFGFLVKPIIFEELKKTLTDCLEKRDRLRRAILPVETAAGTELLSIGEIVYAEVFQHSTSFVMKDGRRVDAAIQLSAAETRLKGRGFFRCHRSYLVNMRCVSRIGQTELFLSDGSAVPLSRHRVREFLDTYARFMGVELG